MMKHLFNTVLRLFAIVPFSYSQVKSNLELIDIFNMEYVSDPQISPDGSRIIYVRNFKDVMTDKNLSNLWIVNFDGSNNRHSPSEITTTFIPDGHMKGEK